MYVLNWRRLSSLGFVIISMVSNRNTSLGLLCSISIPSCLKSPKTVSSRGRKSFMNTTYKLLFESYFKLLFTWSKPAVQNPGQLFHPALLLQAPFHLVNVSGHFSHNFMRLGHFLNITVLSQVLQLEKERSLMPDKSPPKP